MKNCFDLSELYNHSDVMTIPTRPVSTVDAKPQLCSNSDFKECPEYVTLSHCRGKSHFITLKKGQRLAISTGDSRRGTLEDFKRCYLHYERAWDSTGLDRLHLHFMHILPHPRSDEISLINKPVSQLSATTDD